ncbi:MAG: redoxin family protein [Burkholderiales bacterium]|nr:redoxin family protein [Burkholderiales bacterium]
MAARRRFLLFLFVALVALGGGYFAHVWLTEEPAQDPARVLLAARLEDLRGEPQALAQWRGKVLVVNFWATWCPPCLKEMPAFIRLQQQYADKGLQFIGLAIDDKARVATFVAQLGVNYPILMADKEGLTLSREAGNRLGGLPFTVIIDQQGRTVRVELGAVDEKKLEHLLQGLLSPG